MDLCEKWFRLYGDGSAMKMHPNTLRDPEIEDIDGIAV
jgi:hypothetical protein